VEKFWNETYERKAEKTDARETEETGLTSVRPGDGEGRRRQGSGDR